VLEKESEMKVDTASFVRVTHTGLIVSFPVKLTIVGNEIATSELKTYVSAELVQFVPE